MPAWLPALKVILPYVTTVATAAIPAFTQRRGGEKSAELMAQQISELQDAAGHNAESLRLLADQMQKAITAIEDGARENEATLRRAQRIAWLSMGVAALAVTLAVASLLGTGSL